MSFSLLARSMDVSIYAEKSDFFTFFNSPYYSHTNASAVDIYPVASANEISALSPIDGVISKIYGFRSPPSKYFKTPEIEQLILIVPEENRSVYVRLLHVECNIKIGTHVSVGDPLGQLVRSGFFDFWTGNHLHVEVRRLEQPLRAKGGYPLESINYGRKTLRHEAKEIPLMRIKEVNENYILVEPEEGFSKLGNFWGLRGEVNSESGILDCGIPHYCHGGLHLKDTSSLRVGDKVKLCGTIIGTTTQIFRNFIQFKCSQLSVYINDISIKGISLYPWLHEAETIKLIPKLPGTLKHLKKKENIHLRILEKEASTYHDIFGSS